MNSPTNKTVEDNITRMMGKVEGMKDWLVSGRFRRSPNSDAKTAAWPVLPGAYTLGDRRGAVAICTLTSNELFAPLASLPGVAIAGRMYSANLGLEKLIANVTANPSIRFLLVCGRESPYFQVGQALHALFAHGVTPKGHIIQAAGHMPELSHMTAGRVEYFRKQVELVNCTGEINIEKLASTVERLSAQNIGAYQGAPLENEAVSPDISNGDGFRPIQLGGHRQSLAYDPMGFFIITLDRQIGEILVHHYWSDHSPAHFVQGRNAEAILLALLREELISQRSHAGYIGAELAKAETALRLDLPYEQDRPFELSHLKACYKAM